MGHLQLYELKNGQFIGLSLIPKTKKTPQTLQNFTMFAYIHEDMDALERTGEREIGGIVLL